MIQVLPREKLPLMVKYPILSKNTCSITKIEGALGITCRIRVKGRDDLGLGLMTRKWQYFSLWLV